MAENPETARNVIKSFVSNCTECKSINSSPVRWEVEFLDLVVNRERLAVNVKHNNRLIFLTMVDSQFGEYWSEKICK
jgi:hypothetical protein